MDGYHEGWTAEKQYFKFQNTTFLERLKKTTKKNPAG